MPICIFNHKSGLFVSACKHSAFFVVKPGFHMIVRIISIVPVVSKKVKTFRTIIWKRYPDDRKRLGRMKRPRSLAKSWVLSGRSGWSCLKRSYGNALRRLRRSGWSNAIPEIITLFPVIKNKFGADGAEAEKIIHKCSQRVWGLFEISRESPWHQVSEEILCLRGTLLASQCRKIKRKSRYQSTWFALRIKSSIYVASVCKTLAKILLSDPETSLTTPRLLPLRRSRRSYGNYQSPQVVRIVSKYFETTGVIGTIRTIIWKLGLRTVVQWFKKRFCTV